MDVTNSFQTRRLASQLIVQYEYIDRRWSRCNPSILIGRPCTRTLLRNKRHQKTRFVFYIRADRIRSFRQHNNQPPLPLTEPSISVNGCLRLTALPGGTVQTKGCGKLLSIGTGNSMQTTAESIDIYCKSQITSRIAIGYCPTNGVFQAPIDTSHGHTNDLACVPVESYCLFNGRWKLLIDSLRVIYYCLFVQGAEFTNNRWA